MGRKMLEDYRQRAVPAPALPQCEAYVRKVAAMLPVGVPYQVEVISLADRDQPVALPGGFVVVPVKSLQLARDDMAFATALAHAFGHMTLNHGFLRNGDGILMRMPPHASGLIPMSMQARYREWEAEADDYAAKLLQKAGPLAIPDSELKEIQAQLRPKRPAPTLRKPK